MTPCCPRPRWSRVKRRALLAATPLVAGAALLAALRSPAPSRWRVLAAAHPDGRCRILVPWPWPQPLPTPRRWPGRAAPWPRPPPPVGRAMAARPAGLASRPASRPPRALAGRAALLVAAARARACPGRRRRVAWPPRPSPWRGEDATATAALAWLPPSPCPLGR
nr:uncharacterized protein DKFZp434B061-like [Aegilops tauschii subsp. strangulata]